MMGIFPFLRNSITLESGSEFKSPHMMRGIPGESATGDFCPIPCSACTLLTICSSSDISITFEGGGEGGEREWQDYSKHSCQ